MSGGQMAAGLPAGRVTGGTRRAIAFSMSLIMVMSSIESTVVASVLPTVTHDLGGIALYRWVTSAYILANAVVMPVLGRLSDAYGRRPVLFGSLVVFLAGSAASGAASTMQALIFFRVIQGAGAGGLIVIAFTILGDIYEPAERARVQGTLGALGTAAGAAGPIVGALILRAATWRWAFYINIPIGIAAWFMTRRTYVDSHVLHRHRFDVIGAVLLSGGIVGLMLCAGENFSPLGLLISLALLAIFVWHERGVREPLLPLELVRRPGVAFPCLADAVRCAAMFGILNYLPLYVSVHAGGNAANAGLILTPFILGSFVGSSGCGRLAHRFSLRGLSQAALAIFAFGCLVLAALVAWGGTHLEMTLTLFVIGMGQGAGYLALLLVIQVGVARSELGTATGVSTLAKYVGGALGVGLLGAFIVTPASGGAGLEAMATPAMAAGFTRLFLAIAVLVLIALAVGFALPKNLRLGRGEKALTPAA